MTLTVAVAGGGTSGVARAIAIAPVASPTAAETEDWTLPAGQRSLTLGAGQRSVSAAISVVRRAAGGRGAVSFAVTADGAAIGQVTLTIADDDKAVLAVRGPAQVTEGQDRADAQVSRTRRWPTVGGAGRPASWTSR